MLRAGCDAWLGQGCLLHRYSHTHHQFGKQVEMVCMKHCVWRQPVQFKVKVSASNQPLAAGTVSGGHQWGEAVVRADGRGKHRPRTPRRRASAEEQLQSRKLCLSASSFTILKNIF